MRKSIMCSHVHRRARQLRHEAFLVLRTLVTGFVSAVCSANRVLNTWSRKIMAIISIRIDFAADRRIGPGKVKLLEHIDKLGSIAAGGRALGMSYRRAWLLIDKLNSMFSRNIHSDISGRSR
jgi:hypothetical protein